MQFAGGAGMRSSASMMGGYNDMEETTKGSWTPEVRRCGAAQARRVVVHTAQRRRGRGSQLYASAARAAAALRPCAGG
jgi:hypothetical protein